MNFSSVKIKAKGKIKKDLDSFFSNVINIDQELPKVINTLLEGKECFWILDISPKAGDGIRGFFQAENGEIERKEIFENGEWATSFELTQKGLSRLKYVPNEHQYKSYEICHFRDFGSAEDCFTKFSNISNQSKIIQKQYKERFEMQSKRKKNFITSELNKMVMIHLMMKYKSEENATDFSLTIL